MDCFHAQQVAEKYLKALLEELGVRFPKTHDLLQRLNQLLPHHPQLRTLRRGLVMLNDYAVDARYSEATLSKRNAAAACRWSGRTRDACRTLLGLPPRP